LVSSSEEEEVEVEEEDLPIPEALDTRGPDQKFDRLATIHGKSAESPSLIYQNRAGGKLWLSGIPTRNTAHRFPKGVTLQIACMAGAPSSRGGVVLTDALLKHLCVAHGSSRNRDFEEVWPLLRNTMYAGESALIHCLSGRHRAGVGGCVFRALLAQEALIGHSRDHPRRGHEVVGRRDHQDQFPQEPVPWPDPLLTQAIC